MRRRSMSMRRTDDSHRTRKIRRAPTSRVLLFLLPLCLILGYRTAADTINIPVSQDAFIASSHPTRNFEEDKPYLLLGFLGRYTRTVLLGAPDRVQLPEEPPERAYLWFYNTFVGTTATVDVRIRRIEEPWSEEAVTYRDAPAISEEEVGRFTMNDPAYQVEKPGSGRGMWYRVDITDYLLELMAGEDDHGLALVPKGDRGVEFEIASNSAPVDQRPYIALESSAYGEADYRGDDRAAVDETTGERAADGHPAGTVRMVLPPLWDTWIGELSPERNFGDGLGWYENGVPGEPALFLGFNGTRRRTVLLGGFDFSRIPQDVEIREAHLMLYLVYSGSAAPVTIGVHNIESEWRELEVTMKSEPELSDRVWSVTTVEGALLLNEKREGRGRWIRWDVTELVRAIVAGEVDTEGVALRPQGAYGVDRQFDCLESSEDFHPRFEVYLPESSGLESEPAAPERKQPTGPVGAAYPPEYPVTEADVERLVSAVRAVDDSDPYITSYRRPESGTEYTYIGLTATEHDLAMLNRVIDVLRESDREGLWVLTRVGVYRPEIVITFLRSDLEFPDLVETVIHELTHAGSGVMSPFMRPAYFSGKAQHLGYNTIRGYSFLIDNECVGLALPGVFFPRSEVFDLLDRDSRGGMAQTYLTGASGTQDLLTLLDEVNAYTRGLRNNLALFDLQPAGKDLAFRLERMMLFLELYLQVARTGHQADYRAMQECRALCAVVAKLAHNAREAVDQLIERDPSARNGLYRRVFETEYDELAKLYGSHDYGQYAERPFSRLAPTHPVRREFILAY